MASDALKALKYAEDNLGVHTVFEETVEFVEGLDKLLGDLDKAQDLRRQLNEDYADREVELTHEMRGAHTNMSDTRFKSEYKGWERTDAKLREIRTELHKVQSEIQGIEYDVEVVRARIKTGCARMEQLGGYLHYLAVVKTQAEKKTQGSGDKA
jgi:hypothetical protein